MTVLQQCVPVAMQAVQEAEKLVAGVLDDEPKVKFEVRLQQFLEMLASEPTTDKQLEAMNFARNTLNPCAKDCPGPDQEAMLSVRMCCSRIKLCPCMHCSAIVILGSKIACAAL